MATIYCDSTTAVTVYAKDTVYAVNDLVVPASADTGTNHAVAKRYVWKVTDIGSEPHKTHATDYPTWDASYTPDTSTEVSGDITFTCINPDSWAEATPYFAYAVLAAASNNDLIYVAHDHSESLTASTTFTFQANVQVYGVNSSTNALVSTPDPLIGAQSTAYGISLNGAKNVFIYGITFKTGTSTASASITVCDSDNSNFELNNCKLFLGQTGYSTNYLVFGNNSNNSNSFVNLVNSEIQFSYNSTSSVQKMFTNGNVNFINCITSGYNPDRNGSFSGTATTRVYAEGCNFATITGKMLTDQGGNGTGTWTFVNCRFSPGVVMMAAPTIITNRAGIQVFAFNCNLSASGYDHHFHMYHGDHLGETYVSTSTYANDGAAYDGTNRASWQIITRASNASLFVPYASPYIDAYKTAEDGITLSLEGLRASDTDSDADVVAQDDEIWAEFSTQASDGYTNSTITNDRMALFGTPANQTSTKATTDWTINTANDAYKSTFKLESGSVNQKEIGHVRARIYVGIADKTFFVDPQIRGLT